MTRRFYIAPFFAVLFLVSSLKAQPAGKEFDDDGALIYRSGKNIEIKDTLPPIKKENLEAKIAEIKKSIPATCSQHQGIDCEKGADSVDGSVICVDDFKESRENFLEFCTQTRLEQLSEEFLDSSRKLIPKELRKPRQYGGVVTSEIVIKVRNLSGVTAQQVRVEGEIAKRKFQAYGPEQLQPYSLEEYVIQIPESKLPPFSDFRTRYRTLINCANCLSSRTANK